MTHSQHQCIHISGGLLLGHFFFGVNFSLNLIWTDDDYVTYDPSNKQSNQEFNFSPTCFSSSKFTYFAFESSEIKNYLKDLNPHGST